MTRGRGEEMDGDRRARRRDVHGELRFPTNLIAAPFTYGLIIVFTFALIMCLIAAWPRGRAARSCAPIRNPPRTAYETRLNL